MKKQRITIIVALLVLIVLIVVYFFVTKNNEVNEGDVEVEVTENDTSKDGKIIDKNKEDIDFITLTSENGVLELIPIKDNEDSLKWAVKGHEKTDIDQSTAESIASSLSSLTAWEVIDEAPESLEAYGLKEPKTTAEVKYKDGADKKIFVGNTTPDGQYYYAASEGDKKVYIIDIMYGDRFKHTLNSLIDKSLNMISPYSILELNIKQRGCEEIDIEYMEKKEGNAYELEGLGMQTLRMNKPVEGAAVYPTNLQTTVLKNLEAITLKDLIAAEPENLFDYGLDNPSLEIAMRDQTTSVYIKIGNDFDENTVYCMVNDRPQVFTMEKSAIEPFKNVNVLDFIEKFVALHYRVNVEEVSIKSDIGNYEITFGKEEKSSDEETVQNSINDTRKSYLNGKEIEKDTFAGLFELIVGITFDSIDEEAPMEGEPKVEISYKLKNGTDDVKFYDYNKNFYIAETNSVKGRIVSKQTVKRMLDKAEELSK